MLPILSFSNVQHAQSTRSPSFRSFFLKLNGEDTNSCRLMYKRNESTLSLDALFTSTSKKLIQIIFSNNQFRSKETSFFRRGYRRNRIPQKYDFSHGICSQRLTSLLWGSSRFLDSDLSHRSDRFLRGVYHRFAR